MVIGRLQYVCCYRRTINVRAEVDLADIVVLENGRVSCVRSVVSGAVVQRAAGRKSQTSVQTIFLDQLPRAIFQFFTSREK